MTTKQKDTTDPLACDVVWGAKSIGNLIGQSPRQAFHMLEQGHIPGRKVGKRWCSWRSRLMEAVGPGPLSQS
jgi:hypothetical protein